MKQLDFRKSFFLFQVEAVWNIYTVQTNSTAAQSTVASADYSASVRGRSRSVKVGHVRSRSVPWSEHLASCMEARCNNWRKFHYWYWRPLWYQISYDTFIHTEANPILNFRNCRFGLIRCLKGDQTDFCRHGVSLRSSSRLFFVPTCNSDSLPRSVLRIL